MRNARNLRFRFLIMFLLFIPMMYALPPEGITIKGKVTDETLKEGVPGANVTVKGTSIGAITDYRVCNPRNSSGRQEIYHSHLERRLAEPW